MLWLHFLFWVAAAALVYTYAGYPLLLRLLVRRIAPSPHAATGASTPSISVVIAARHESARIVSRVENLLASQRSGAMEIIVVCDGPDPAIQAALTALHEPAIRVISLPQTAGKAACLNLGVSAAQHELVVFADARQRFHPAALLELSRPFADAAVGAVSGALEIDPARAGIGQGLDRYWRLEKSVRLSESLLDSSIGCTGAIYAIRRSLFRPIPEDTILDDVEIPMRIAVEGARVLFASTAVAWDGQQLEPHLERRRKRRTLAGNFQMLVRHPEWLHPARNRLWWQLVSHKYLRLTGPFCLAALLLASLALSSYPFYFAALCAQLTCYLAATLGALRISTSRFCSICAGFVFLNWMVLEGLWLFLFGSPQRGWAQPITTPPAASEAPTA